MLTRNHTTRIALAAMTFAVIATHAGRAWAISDAQLLERAKASRKAAETALAEARKQNLAERKALAAELQRAYDDLAAAEAQAAEAQNVVAELNTDVKDLDRAATITAHRTQSLIAQAAGAAQAEIDPNADADALEQAIWKGLSDQLSGLEGNSRISVETRKVITRSGQQAKLPVLSFGGYASYACGSKLDTCGLLRTLPDGKQVIVGPGMPRSHVDALIAAAAGRLEYVPLDIDGTLIDRAPAEPKTPGSWLAAGGLFVYPILAVAALGLLLIADRVYYLLASKASPSLVSKVVACLVRNDAAQARDLIPSSRKPIARVLLAAAEAADKPAEQREAAMESALLAEAPKLERSLSMLGALAGVAPLLGLLGTVSGMIATFDTISSAGTGNPRLLSGGISEALITTQLGLMVAIPLLLSHAWLSRWVQRREAMLEYNAIQAFGIQHGETEKDPGK